MRILVTTSTGQIGRPLASRLLDAGASIVLPVRRPEAVADLAARGAEVLQGSQDDADFLTRAMRGVDAVFWLTPPDYHATDFREHQRHFGGVAAQALRAARVQRLVNLSALGAHVGSGIGQVDGAADVEKILNGSVPNHTHLRPAYFMENFLAQLPNIKSAQSIRMPMSPATRAPMVATADIAAAAAARLLDTAWKGPTTLELLGPEDLSYQDAAAQIGAGLGMKISYAQIPEARMREAIAASGRAGPSFIELVLEMYRAIEKGTMCSEVGRTPASTTPTTVKEFASTVMAKAMTGKGA